MTRPSDADYYTRRAEESRVAADRADYAGSVDIHTTLAEAYDDLAQKAAHPSAPLTFVEPTAARARQVLPADQVGEPL